ncbi:MAG: RNase H family protein [Lachnospira eligens]
MENTTENQLALTAIVQRTYEEFNKGCDICINTSNEHVLNSCRNAWPQQWAKNNWVKSNGKQVKNAELWQQYLNVSRMHNISWSDEKEHEFSKWIDHEFKKMEAEYVRV